MELLVYLKRRKFLGLRCLVLGFILCVPLCSSVFPVVEVPKLATEGIPQCLAAAVGRSQVLRLKKNAGS